MNDLAKNAKITKRTPKKTSARTGMYRDDYQQYLESIGWEWIPTMKVGSGCQMRLNAKELPSGRLIAKVSKHLVAVIDGVGPKTRLAAGPDVCTAIFASAHNSKPLVSLRN